MRCPCQSCECDEGDYADKERHNPEKRSCTDVYCLVIFFLFMLGMMICAAVAGSVGDPRRLINGYDSWGNACAQSKNKKIDNVTLSGRNTDDTPKLFYYDWKDASVSRKPKEMKVCVSRCPENVTEGPTHNSTALEDLFNEGIKVCRYDVTLEEIQKKTYDKALCPKEISPHVSILNRCMPRTLVNVGRSIQSAVTNVVKKQAKKNQAYSSCNLKSSWIRKMSNDILLSWETILLLSFVSLILSIIVAVLITYLAKVMIWVMYVGAAATALGGTELCWHKWYQYDSLLEAVDKDLRLKGDIELVQSWLAFAICATILTLVWLLVLLYMTRKFEVVIDFMQEAGFAVRDMPLLMLQPLLTLIVLIITFVIMGTVQLYVFSAGYIKQIPNNGLYYYFFPLGAKTFIAYYCLLGTLWVVQFYVHCQQFVVAGTVSRWYFTQDKSEIRRNRSEYIIRTHMDLIRYHLGTTSVGSFIIVLCQIPRMIITFIMQKAENKHEGCAVRCKGCCCGGIWLYEKVLKFITRNSYIVCSMYGQNFFLSGGRIIMTMLFSNVVHMMKVNFVTTFTLFLGQMGITAIVTITAMVLIKPSNVLCNWYAPLLVNAFISMCITYIVLNIPGMAVDTLYFCFAEDCEQNDGTNNMPYYMNSRLGKHIDHAQDEELDIRRKRASYGKPRTSYKPGRYSRVSAGDIIASVRPKNKEKDRKVAQAPEDLW